MPSISRNFDPRVGPLLQLAIVGIGFGHTVQSAEESGAERPVLHLYDALIDTGATTTCISQKVVTDLDLNPIGKTQMTGATGVSPVNQYAFGVGFLLQAPQAPAGTVGGNLLVREVQGCLFNKGSATFDVLLGRDIICSGAFHLSNDGHFTLSV